MSNASVWACTKNCAHLFVRVKGDELCPYCALAEAERRVEALEGRVLHDESFDETTWTDGYTEWEQEAGVQTHWDALDPQQKKMWIDAAIEEAD